MGFVVKHKKSAKPCRDKVTKVLCDFTEYRLAEKESSYWDRFLVEVAFFGVLVVLVDVADIWASSGMSASISC